MMKKFIIQQLHSMNRCLICSSKIEEGSEVREAGNLFQTTKSCYKCGTHISYLFTIDFLSEITFICSKLKLIINDKVKTLSKMEEEFNSCFNGYLSLRWKVISKMDENFEFDLKNLKEIKNKMETMVTFL